MHYLMKGKPGRRRAQMLANERKVTTKQPVAYVMPDDGPAHYVYEH